MSMDRCSECQKKISDEEYVVNWGSCSDCFDRSYEEYCREQEKRAASSPDGCAGRELEDDILKERGVV